ncbi:MAG: hypothetical protein PUD59_00615 [bacterium]|nr:hypothetical protein [bacterium]
MRVEDLQNNAMPSRQMELDKKKKLLRSLSIVFIIAIITVGLWVYFFKLNSYTKKYENNYLSFKYDTTWKVIKDDKTLVSLSHETKSFIDINITNLTSNNINSNIESIIDEVKYDIEKQNSDYKLINEESCIISENKYEAYKMLYESSDSQSLVVAFKTDNYLVVFNYTSSNNYFDILLDSFQLTLGSLILK